MTAFSLLGVVVSVTALFAYLNRRYLRLDASIGVTVIGLAASLLITLLTLLHVPLAERAGKLLASVRFDEVLFQGLLSFLLFVGALNIDVRSLWEQRGPILSFALIGTLVSTLLLGAATYWLLAAFGMGVSWPAALLFGAIISPTDPVAVLSLLRSAGLPARVQTLIAGESLFNDGIGVVVFAVLVTLLGGGNHGPAPDALGILGLFVQEAGGGAAFGLALGGAAYLLLRQIDDPAVEVLITLALTTGGYALASALHVSGPLAMVLAGLLLGPLVRRGVVSPANQVHFDAFWHLIDELLNAGLFVLIGLEALVVNFSPRSVLLGLITIPLALLARLLSVQLPMLALQRLYTFGPYTRRLLVWGGLRGGIAIALAFSVPPGRTHDLYLVMTYVVVVFSIVVQGLSMGRLATRALAATRGQQPA